MKHVRTQGKKRVSPGGHKMNISQQQTIAVKRADSLLGCIRYYQQIEGRGPSPLALPWGDKSRVPGPVQGWVLSPVEETMTQSNNRPWGSLINVYDIKELKEQIQTHLKGTQKKDRRQYVQVRIGNI